MTSFLRYVERNKNISLDEKPFNIIDALVLTAIVYLPFPYNELFNTNSQLTVNRLIEDYLARTDKTKTTFSTKLDHKLALKLFNSKRYSSLIMAGYIKRIDLDNEKQFTALTLVGKKGVFVAYMGTDTSLVGWKEDLNLSFKKAIPSQESAVEYLIQIANKFKDKDIYLAGHSKGGNLAMYASIFAPLEIQKRINTVINFDGPGLLEDVLKTKEYNRIKKRIITVVPSYSFVGIIFEKSDNFLIIKSKGILAANHLFYYWNVIDDDFEYVKKLSKFSIRAHHSIRYIMKNLSEAEREIFVREIYKLLCCSGAYSVFDLFKKIPTLISNMSISISSMDEKDKKVLSKALKIIIAGSFKHSKEMAEFEEINSKWLLDDK